MTAPTPECSIIVPVYDERDSVAELADQIDSAFAPLDRTFEILFVDDGSADGTWEVLDELSERFSFVNAIRLRRNFGKSAALGVGVDHAQGSILITIDGDLQDDPAEIPRFLEEIDRGGGLVSGWKVNRRDPLSKRLPSRVFNWVTSKACGINMRDHNCGFKAGPTELYRSIPLYGELHRFIPAMASNLGYEVVEIPVNHRAREHGRSKFGLERYVRGFLDLITVLMITRYRSRPGHLLGGLGLLLGTIGILILSYLTGIWAFTDDPIGTRPLLVLGVMLITVSTQLFSFGIIAELIVNSSERAEHPDLVRQRTAS